jgi:hypothetical protein
VLLGQIYSVVGFLGRVRLHGVSHWKSPSCLVVAGALVGPLGAPLALHLK